MTAAPARPPIVTRPFVTLMAANGLLRLCSFMLSALVPLFVIESGGSAFQAGLTTTFYMFAAVLLRPAAGRLVDVRGRFIVMVVGAVIYCLASGLFVITLPIWAVLAVRALQGAGFSLNGTAVMTLATDVIPESRMAEGIGILGAEQVLAQVIGPGLALELKDVISYTAAFAVVFALGLVNLLVRIPLGRFAKERDRARRGPAEIAPPSAPLWERLVERGAWRPSVIIFLVMFGTVGLGTFLAAFAIDRGISNVGPFYVASGIMVAVSRLIVGRMLRDSRPAVGIVSGMVLIAACLALVAWTPNLLVLVVAGACFGAGMGLVQPGVNALAVLAAPPSRRGLANSTYFMAMDLSQAIAALLLGAVADVLGLGSVFVIGFGVVLIALVAFVVLDSRRFFRSAAGAVHHRPSVPEPGSS